MKLSSAIQAGLCLLGCVLAIGGVRTLAQDQAQHPAAPPAAQGPIQNGWVVLISAVVTSAGAVAHAWVTSGSNALRRRAEEAEREVEELVKQLEESADERKAAEKERDTWMRRAYSQGWKSSDDIRIPRDLR